MPREEKKQERLIDLLVLKSTEKLSIEEQGELNDLLDLSLNTLRIIFMK